MAASDLLPPELVELALGHVTAPRDIVKVFKALPDALRPRYLQTVTKIGFNDPISEAPEYVTSEFVLQFPNVTTVDPYIIVVTDYELLNPVSALNLKDLKVVVEASRDRRFIEESISFLYDYSAAHPKLETTLRISWKGHENIGIVYLTPNSVYFPILSPTWITTRWNILAKFWGIC